MFMKKIRMKPKLKKKKVLTETQFLNWNWIEINQWLTRLNKSCFFFNKILNDFL